MPSLALPIWPSPVQSGSNPDRWHTHTHTHTDRRCFVAAVRTLPAALVKADRICLVPANDALESRFFWFNFFCFCLLQPKTTGVCVQLHVLSLWKAFSLFFFFFRLLTLPDFRSFFFFLYFVFSSVLLFAVFRFRCQTQNRTISCRTRRQIVLNSFDLFASSFSSFFVLFVLFILFVPSRARFFIWLSFTLLFRVDSSSSSVFGIFGHTRFLTLFASITIHTPFQHFSFHFHHLI